MILSYCVCSVPGLLKFSVVTLRMDATDLSLTDEFDVKEEMEFSEILSIRGRLACNGYKFYVEPVLPIYDSVYELPN